MDRKIKKSAEYIQYRAGEGIRMVNLASDSVGSPVIPDFVNIETLEKAEGMFEDVLREVRKGIRALEVAKAISDMKSE